jgi:hypothetical protein
MYAFSGNKDDVVLRKVRKKEKKTKDMKARRTQKRRRRDAILGNAKGEGGKLNCVEGTAGSVSGYDETSQKCCWAYMTFMELFPALRPGGCADMAWF